MDWFLRFYQGLDYFLERMKKLQERIKELEEEKGNAYPVPTKFPPLQNETGGILLINKIHRNNR